MVIKNQINAYAKNQKPRDTIRQGFSIVYKNLELIDGSDDFLFKMEKINKTIDILSYFIDSVIVDKNVFPTYHDTSTKLFEFWVKELTKSLKEDVKVVSLKQSIKPIEEMILEIN